jgi:chromosomal replication initiation ATPase DnaA
MVSNKGISAYAIPGLKHKLKPSKDDVLRSVTQVFGISPEKMLERTRKAYVVAARQVYFYFLYNELHWTLQKIADECNMNHATVMHSIRVVKDHADVEPDYNKKLFAIKKMIDSSVKSSSNDSTIVLHPYNN